MAEWQRMVATTIADYKRGVEDELTAERALLAMLKKTGQIVYNADGLSLNWQTEHRIATLTPDTGEQTVTPTRQNRYQQPSLTYLGYTMSDAMTEREKLMNRGVPALVKYFENMSKNLFHDANEKFPEEFYNDGTVNTSRYSGIDTMMGVNGTVNIGAGTQRTANAADVVGYPNNTYAGLSCTLGGVSGSWGQGTAQTSLATTWPNGRGDMGYDFWSPVIVNTTSSAWGAATNTFPDTCVLCTRFGIMQMNRYKCKRGALKTIMYDRENYRLYLNRLDSKERAIVQENLGMRSLGFEQSFHQDGVDIMWEFGMPAGNGYGFNAENMVLHSMYDSLYNVDGPTFAPLSKYYWVIVSIMGQLQFTAPRFFLKLTSLA